MRLRADGSGVRFTQSALAAETPGSTLAEATGWVQVAPEGTTCWDGSPWHFWYHGGSADKLAVWFEGGGACWNAALCDVEGTRRFRRRWLRDRRQQRTLRSTAQGNPLRDFSVVLLPYCTGDLHIGRRTVEYRRPTERASSSRTKARATPWPRSTG
jgi:hypothetical protein